MGALKWILPIVGANLVYEAVSRSDFILAMAAVGVWRTWWCDALDHDKIDGWKVLARIVRWTLFGSVAVTFWRAKETAEYLACAIVFTFLVFWRQGWLRPTWNAMRELRLPKRAPSAPQIEEPHSEPIVERPAVVVRPVAKPEVVPVTHSAPTPPPPAAKAKNPSLPDYKAEGEQAFAAFQQRDAELRRKVSELLLRLSKLKEDADGHEQGRRR